MILFDSDHYSISLDTSVPCLVWAANVKLDSTLFRESEIKLLELYKKYIQHHDRLQILVDARIVGAVSAEDTTWLAEEILPELSSAGLKRDAFLVPETALEKLIVRNFISKSGDTIEMQTFSEIEEARSWLRKAR